MAKEPHVTIMRICKVMFKLLCTKVYDPTTYEDLKIGVIYSLYYVHYIIENCMGSTNED